MLLTLGPDCVCVPGLTTVPTAWFERLPRHSRLAPVRAVPRTCVVKERPVRVSHTKPFRARVSHGT